MDMIDDSGTGTGTSLILTGKIMTIMVMEVPVPPNSFSFFTSWFFNYDSCCFMSKFFVCVRILFAKNLRDNTISCVVGVKSVCVCTSKMKSLLELRRIKCIWVRLYPFFLLFFVYSLIFYSIIVMCKVCDKKQCIRELTKNVSVV